MSHGISTVLNGLEIQCRVQGWLAGILVTLSLPLMQTNTFCKRHDTKYLQHPIVIKVNFLQGMFGIWGVLLSTRFSPHLKKKLQSNLFLSPCSHIRQPISLNLAISTRSCGAKGSGQKTSRLDENVYFILTELSEACVF